MKYYYSYGSPENRYTQGGRCPSTEAGFCAPGEDGLGCCEPPAKPRSYSSDMLTTLNAKKLTFEDYVREIYADAQAVLLRKHKDYGSKNIGQSPGGPLNGLRVRIWDKVARINNLIDSGAEPEHESLRDSFLDMLNYSAIALLVIDGHWPEG